VLKPWGNALAPSSYYQSEKSATLIDGTALDYYHSVRSFIVNPG
jgi:hypothetical protein